MIGLKAILDEVPRVEIVATASDAIAMQALLVRQVAEACVRDRVDGVPEPVDPALGEVAVAWAVRDLLTHLDGGRPTTWSVTLTLDADLGGIEHRPWQRHPECACSWA